MRYYKATDGVLTIFRASRGEYAFGCFTTGPAASPQGRIGFSNIPGSDRHTAVLISKAEYDRLVERKNERIRNMGRDPKSFTAPSDSWVRAAGKMLEGEG